MSRRRGRRRRVESKEQRAESREQRAITDGSLAREEKPVLTRMRPSLSTEKMIN
jgi:hypothetical protein